MPDGFTLQEALKPAGDAGFSLGEALKPTTKDDGLPWDVPLTGDQMRAEQAARTKADAALKAVEPSGPGLAHLLWGPIGLAQRGGQAALGERPLPSGVEALEEASLGARPAKFTSAPEPAPAGPARVEPTVGPRLALPAPDATGFTLNEAMAAPRSDPWIPGAETGRPDHRGAPPSAPQPVAALASDLKPGDKVLIGDRTHEIEKVRPWVDDQLAVKLKDDPKLHIGAPDAPVRRFAEIEGPTAIQAHGGPWMPAGKNTTGETVYENANGARAIMEDGVPYTEAVVEHPVKGLVPKKPDARKPTFEVVPEKEGATAEAATPEPVTPPESTPARSARAKREPTPYVPEPKEPKRLVQFLRDDFMIGRPGDINTQTSHGGLRDTGGDLAAIVGGKKGLPPLRGGRGFRGLINNDTGSSLDDAAQRAWQAGYFPEHDERPTINDLLNKIDEDLNRNNPAYSHHDQDAVEAYHEALGQNGEINRLASLHDIPTTGLTHDRFFDALADKLSLDDMAIEHARLEEAHDEAYKMFEGAAKEIGGSDWKPDEFHGSDQSRSLDDLENEYRQEVAATEAQQRAGGGKEPGTAPPASRAGEEGGGRIGRASGDPGRAGAQGGAGETDLLGHAVRAPIKRAPEPTIRDDPDQIAMPGMQPSAVQAQASRDAAGPRSGQERANEGLFAPKETEQPELVSRPLVISFEAYAAERGVSRQDYGDAGLHRSSNNESARAFKANRANQHTKDLELTERLRKLSEEYDANVVAGRIRPPTKRELLEARASGHPDNESVQAARRLLAKMDAAKLKDTP